jgi:hypothetical protein
MTLVIAGHTLQAMFEEESNFVEGLFAVSDTAITSGGIILVSGFKKVVEIPIRVKSPVFCDEWLNGYMGYHYEAGCFVAFAGSTLVAQHMMNSISNHLSELYPTYEDGEYKIVMPCEQTRHLEQGYYDKSMFLVHHLNALLSAEKLSDIVQHSIQSVLERAKKHNGMKRNFSAFCAEFIFGVRCPINAHFHLYQYEIISDNNDGAIAKKSEVPQGKVAVIGLRNLYAEQANSAFESAIKNGKNTAKEMHHFVARAIESQNEIGVFSIGKPCVLYKYKGKHVEQEKRIC